MATHDEVAKNFAARKVNKQTGDVTWKGKNVSCQGNVIDSFGWWPMAYHLGEKGGEHVFLIRADRYSASTSQHQGSVLHHCHGPIVSFDALAAANVRADYIALENILDYEGETRIHLTREDGQYFRYGEPFTPPTQGMFVVTRREMENGHVRGYWHILGGVVIECGPSRYLLCGLDEDTYFVSELPRRPISVKDAFEILKPPAVIKAEMDGLNVLRQGEWFFIPTDLTDRDITDMLGFKHLKEMRSRAEMGPLPNQRGTNRHICKHVDTYAADHRTGQLVGEKRYARGSVRHVDRWGDAAGHRMLRLGDVWHQAVRNTEVASWSMGGRFD